MQDPDGFVTPIWLLCHEQAEKEKVLGEEASD